MRARVVLCSAALLAFSCALRPSRAFADSFDFSFTGISSRSIAFVGSGTLTTTPQGNGAELVTSITGTVTTLPVGSNVADVQTITGVVSTGATPVGYQSFPDTFNYSYDNLIFPNGNVSSGVTGDFDEDGLSFVTSDPGTGGNVFYDLATGIATGSSQNPFTESGTLLEGFNGNLGFDQATYLPVKLNFNLTPQSVTPEPASIALLGSGLLGVAGVLRRRRA